MTCPSNSGARRDGCGTDQLRSSWGEAAGVKRQEVAGRR